MSKIFKRTEKYKVENIDCLYYLQRDIESK